MDVKTKVRLGTLLDIYGGLLTNKQFDILRDYLYNDQGLSEIADSNDTSRQAVSDIIKRSIMNMEKYERQLGLYEKLQIILDKIHNICDNNIKDKELRERVFVEFSQLFKSFRG